MDNYSCNMFVDQGEKNVTLVIDTSGSMYNFLDAVKQHAVEFLKRLANSTIGSHFNVIEFSSDVTQWADKQVICTSQTVGLAAQWIKQLSPKTGTNTLDALQVAFNDPQCQAVYLVSEGLPDQHPADVLDLVAALSCGRPVHTIYIYGGQRDANAILFLQQLAIETYGSFHVVSITKHGLIDRISPVYRADLSGDRLTRTTSGSIVPNIKACSLTTTLDQPPVSNENLLITPKVINPNPLNALHPVLYGGPYYGWTRYRPGRFYSRQNHINVPEDPETAKYVLAAGSLLIDKKVLARRIENGLYYEGTVRSQLYEDRFLIEFVPQTGTKFDQTDFQETHVFDLIALDDALRHSVVPGDKVLAPNNPRKGSYAPGHVIKGTEKRSTEGTRIRLMTYSTLPYLPYMNEGFDDSAEDLLVTFTHSGQTEAVPRDRAVWIPASLYDRILFELKLPPTARRTFHSHNNYPTDTFPGYPTSNADAKPLDYDKVSEIVIEQPHVFDWPLAASAAPYYPYWPHWPFFPGPFPGYMPVPRINKTNKFIPRSSVVSKQEIDAVAGYNDSTPDDDLQTRELYDHVDSQLKHHERLHRTSSAPPRKLSYGDGISSSYNGDVSDYDSDLQNDASTQTTRDAATSTRKTSRFSRRNGTDVRDRPPWRYWHHDEAPSLLCKKCPDPLLVPYRDYKDLPLEAWHTRDRPFGSVQAWSNPNSQYVEPWSRYKADAEVMKKLFHSPVPPSKRHEHSATCRQNPGMEIGVALSDKDAERAYFSEQQARNNFRRQQCMNRLERMAKSQAFNEYDTDLSDYNRRARNVNHTDFERSREVYHKQREANIDQRRSENRVRFQLRDQQRSADADLYDKRVAVGRRQLQNAYEHQQRIHQEDYDQRDRARQDFKAAAYDQRAMNNAVRHDLVDTMCQLADNQSRHANSLRRHT